MGGTDKWRYTVAFFQGGTRDVTAATEEGAKRTALYAERITGRKGRLTVVSVKRLWPVGTHRQGQLFDLGPNPSAAESVQPTAE